MNDDFNWNDTSIIIHEQPQTAVYRNPYGQIVIRQRQWPEDDDQYVYVSREFAGLLVRAIMDAAECEPDALAPPLSPTSAERSRRYRQRKRDGSGVTDGGGERDADRHVTVPERDGVPLLRAVITPAAE